MLFMIAPNLRRKMARKDREYANISIFYFQEKYVFDPNLKSSGGSHSSLFFANEKRKRVAS